MLTTGEVAKRLGVTDRTIRNWIESGRLKGFRFGNSYRIAEEDLEKFIIDSAVINEEKENKNID